MTIFLHIYSDNPDLAINTSKFMCTNPSSPINLPIDLNKERHTYLDSQEILIKDPDNSPLTEAEVD